MYVCKKKHHNVLLFNISNGKPKSFLQADRLVKFERSFSAPPEDFPAICTEEFLNESPITSI